jgi:hypothetical protein
VIGHHIDDDFESELMGFGAQCGQFGRRSQCVGADLRVARAVERVPNGRPGVVTLCGRGLHCRESGIGNHDEIGRNIGVFPVETMQYHTLLDCFRKTVGIACIRWLQGQQGQGEQQGLAPEMMKSSFYHYDEVKIYGDG